MVLALTRRVANFWLSYLILIFIGMMLFSSSLFSQPRETEEIVVTFDVRRLITEDVFARYDGDNIYLPLVEIFSLLGMNATVDRTSREIRGFLFLPNQTFSLNYQTFRLTTFEGKYMLTRRQLVIDGLGIYLRLDQFERLFSLPLEFEFTELRVTLPMDKELPIYKRIERKRKYEKLKRQEEPLHDVQQLPLRRSFVSGGFLDWQLSLSPIGRQSQFFDLKLGSAIAGGDLVVAAGGSSSQGIDPNQLNYRWRYSLQDKNYISQIGLGEILTVGAMGRSMTGGMVTNRPLVQRRYFQTISFGDNIGQNWEVELYVDDILVDHQSTDASGAYYFTTNLVYGNSRVTIKMYGPEGEIRTEDKHYLVPFQLLPRGEFEYTLAAGEENIIGSPRSYGQAQAFYGINDWMTAGLGFELPIGAKDDEKPNFTGEIGIRAAGSMTFSSSFVSNKSINLRGAFSRSSLVSITAGYTRFMQNEISNPIHQEQRIVLSASAPLKVKGKQIGLRIFSSIDKIAGIRLINVNYGVNGSFGRVSMNYIGRYRQTRASVTISELVSQSFLTIHVHSWIRPQFRVTYNHSRKSMEKYGLFMGRRIFRTGQLSISYERNETIKSHSIQMSLNLFTGFLNSTTKALSTDRGFSMNQVHRGSIRYDKNTHTVQFDRHNSVGYGSAVVRPFLDRNFNSVMDKGEEWLSGIRPRLKGVSGIPKGSNNLYYYNRLRPFDDYLIQIDETSLDDPTLKPIHENYLLTVGPNMVTAINVPIVVTSELSGTVSRRLPQGSILGVGGFKIHVMNLATEEVREIPTFNNGEFYYLGLIPGSYRAYLDPEELKRLGFTCEPLGIDFDAEPTEGGASIEGIDFIIIPKK